MQSGSTSSWSYGQPAETPSLKGIRAQTGNYLGKQLQQPGYGTQPMGPLAGMYQNLFSENPQDDWLGAKKALMESLNGGSFRQAAGDVYGMMLPSVMDAYRTGAAGLRDAAGPGGMRFSTDLINSQSNLLNNQLLGLQNTAAQNALGYMGQRGGLASGMFNMAGDFGLRQIANQLPLLIHYATQFAPVAQQSGSSGSNLGVL